MLPSLSRTPMDRISAVIRSCTRACSARRAVKLRAAPQILCSSSSGSCCHDMSGAPARRVPLYTTLRHAHVKLDKLKPVFKHGCERVDDAADGHGDLATRTVLAHVHNGVADHHLAQALVRLSQPADLDVGGPRAGFEAVKCECHAVRTFGQRAAARVMFVDAHAHVLQGVHLTARLCGHCAPAALNTSPARRDPHAKTQPKRHVGGQAHLDACVQVAGARERS
ncbi:hypothetical protein [Philosamia cynthia ricini nucleopolyhedrovirus virus]|nr:hypothetical protein [Philosamia cynthia ricini nucleopolyhedrovirus virus]